MPNWLAAVHDAYAAYIPYYSQGIGWLIPVLLVVAVTGIIAVVSNKASTTISTVSSNENRKRKRKFK